MDTHMLLMNDDRPNAGTWDHGGVILERGSPERFCSNTHRHKHTHTHD